MSKSRLITLGVIALAVSGISACSPAPTPRSLGVSASSVVKVELYEYPWGTATPTDRLTIVNDDRNALVVEELTSMFTEVPTTALSAESADETPGNEALGVRYTLADGTTTEITRIFLGYHDVVLLWPDGQATHTEWGSPDLLDYYAEFGEVKKVDAAERPHAALPQ